MHGTCKDCTHWTRNSGGHSRPGATGFGICGSDKFVKGYDTPWSEVPVDGMVVEDDEGWGFFTGEDFYCPHIKKRRAA